VISGSTNEGSSPEKITVTRGNGMASHMESGMKRQLREERRTDRGLLMLTFVIPCCWNH
jgi:hypothetical protein